MIGFASFVLRLVRLGRYLHDKLHPGTSPTIGEMTPVALDPTQRMNLKLSAGAVAASLALDDAGLRGEPGDRGLLLEALQFSRPAAFGPVPLLGRDPGR